MASLTYQGQLLSLTDSYRYMGQEILVPLRLLLDFALMQVTLFQQAALWLHHAAC